MKLLFEMVAAVGVDGASRVIDKPGEQMGCDCLG